MIGADFTISLITVHDARIFHFSSASQHYATVLKRVEVVSAVDDIECKLTNSSI
jgi:hypothetical protein